MAVSSLAPLWKCFRCGGDRFKVFKVGVMECQGCGSKMENHVLRDYARECQGDLGPDYPKPWRG